MTTKQAEPDLDSWKDQERRQQQRHRRRKVGAIAVAAAIAVMGVVVCDQRGRGRSVRLCRLSRRFEAFIAWLGAEHPEAGQVYEGGELFRTGGQELVHILTQRSVDLLATYLEEYEHSLSS